MNILTIKAYTKEEALEEAEKRGITAYKNLTSYWVLKGRPTGYALTRLVVEWLEKNDLSEAEGSVFILVDKGWYKETKGSAKISRFIPEKISAFHKIIEIRDEDGKLYARTSTIGDAMRLIKKQSVQYKKNLIARIIKSSDNYDNSIIAKSEYINSSKLEKSTYMFFGNYKKIVECEV